MALFSSAVGFMSTLFSLCLIFQTKIVHWTTHPSIEGLCSICECCFYDLSCITYLS